jgi:hypothetical protein
MEIIQGALQREMEQKMYRISNTIESKDRCHW